MNQHSCTYCGAGIDGPICKNCEDIRNDLWKCVSVFIEMRHTQTMDGRLAKRMGKIEQSIFDEILKIRTTNEARAALEVKP